MSDEHRVSRRATLKSIGAAGAVLVLGGTATAVARQAAPKAAGATQDKPPANVVDVAAARFSKGHS